MTPNPVLKRLCLDCVNLNPVPNRGQRLDDGLGPALADALEKLDLPGVSVDADYQLMIEDAAEVAEHDFAIFADAAVKATDRPAYAATSGAPVVPVIETR